MNSRAQTCRLADLERMLHPFSNKAIPDCRENIILRLDDHIQSVQEKESCEDEMFIIKYFKKGCTHIMFRKPELVDKLKMMLLRNTIRKPYHPFNPKHRLSTYAKTF
ncbi:TPA: DUF4942 domain-containing protein [Escherichia coli]|nr:DUF4942 domain-containing protein [Escherichia coli]EEI7711812.1 DUF4942 domain-containing protein [Salmonella enterica subsp. enterica serovar Indiana]EEZ9806833.1 DUF4942 domain-containing protein [Escherichia coli O25]EAC1480461.1 DUF4942 domain-containing protein [Escherichia coli]EEW1616157.1 DUF4942 domain-containing protein [Escherichia coli]